MLTFQIEVTFLKPKYPRSLQTLNSVVTLTVKPQFFASHSPFVFFKGSHMLWDEFWGQCFTKLTVVGSGLAMAASLAAALARACFCGFAAGPNHHRTASVTCCWGFPVLKRGECLFHLSPQNLDQEQPSLINSSTQLFWLLCPISLSTEVQKQPVWPVCVWEWGRGKKGTVRLISISPRILPYSSRGQCIINTTLEKKEKEVPPSKLESNALQSSINRLNILGDRTSSLQNS